jgi:hypothetical protein
VHRTVKQFMPIEQQLRRAGVCAVDINTVELCLPGEHVRLLCRRIIVCRQRLGQQLRLRHPLTEHDMLCNSLWLWLHGGRSADGAAAVHADGQQK